VHADPTARVRQAGWILSARALRWAIVAVESVPNGVLLLRPITPPKWLFLLLWVLPVSKHHLPSPPRWTTMEEHN
jgi:hypothetical protein